MLPKIDMGDVLVIHDTGAHGFSMGYNYNGKLKSAEVLLKEDGSTQLIRCLLYTSRGFLTSKSSILLSKSSMICRHNFLNFRLEG